MSGAFARAAWLLLFCRLAVAQTPTLAVEDAWIRAAPGASTAAAYLILHNHAATPVTIVEVQSAAAAHVMIHESSLQEGQSRMRPRDRLVIPAGQSVKLSPGGLHVMLDDLKDPLTVGERVPLRILLADGTSVQVSAAVRPLSAD